jgi:hypothetical protein
MMKLKPVCLVILLLAAFMQGQPIERGRGALAPDPQQLGP